MATATFFLSSTIHDFRDLRSALKYHLEGQGCTVLASEFNDFRKRLDVHSYEACLQSLQQSDYFVLLVGARVGGWYDPLNRVSITQQEYRAAYELHKQNKLKLLIFVRGDVWQMRDDRNELKKHLEAMDIDPALGEGILNLSNKHASDAAFICDFISEVSRNRETKEALRGGSDFPTGNWVHVFDNFSDIADVLQSQAFMGLPVQDAVMRRLLQRELIELLRQGLAKMPRGRVYAPTRTMELFHQEHKLERLAPDRPEPIIVRSDRWDMLSSFAVHIIGRQFHTQILQRALESTTFLEYDPESGMFSEASAYEALYKLQQEVRLFNQGNTTEVLSVIFKHSPRNRGLGDQISIASMELLQFLHLMDRWINIVELARSIVRHLSGEPLELHRLRPASPIPAMNVALAEEAVSLEDVEAFLK